jgi:hypothetical protein
VATLSRGEPERGHRASESDADDYEWCFQWVTARSSESLPHERFAELAGDHRRAQHPDHEIS